MPANPGIMRHRPGRRTTILLKLLFDRIKGSNLVGIVIELGRPYLSVRPDTHAVREILCRSREISEGCVRGFITNVHMMDLLLSWNRGVGTKNFLQTGTDIGQLFVRQVRDEKYRAHSGDKLSPLLGGLPSPPHNPREIVTGLAGALDVADVFFIAECRDLLSGRDLRGIPVRLQAERNFNGTG